MKGKITLMAVFLLAGAFAAPAVEKTGAEISSLIKSLDNDLTVAKEKVDKLESERKSFISAKPEKVLPERADALRTLDDIAGKFDNAEEPNEKKAYEKKLEDQALKVAKLSADYLENHKNVLLNQDKQLEVMEEALSSVIGKMDKLQKITEKGLGGKDGGMTAEQAKVQARKNLRNLATVVEMFAGKDDGTHQWKSIRQTIMLRDALLKRSTATEGNVQKLLLAQKEVYEQVLSQVCLIRQSLQEEKRIVAQAALGEIARSMLRKAASILIGNSNIEGLSTNALAQMENRSQNILDFLQQDTENGSNTYYSLNSSSGNQYPDGYQDWMDSKIN